MATLKRDQQQISGRWNTGPVTYLSGDYWVASNFTPSVSGNLDKLYLMVDKVGTPGGALVVSVYATSSGKPTGSALATQSISESSVPDKGLLTVTFSSPASLTASTLYAIVLSNNDGKGGTPDTSNYYKPAWTASGEDYYGSGITDYYSSDGGSTWSNNSTSDLAFVTEMSVATATPGIDQFIFCNGGYGEFINSSSMRIAQTFKPSVSAQLKKVKVHLYRIDGQTAGTVYFEIYAVDGSNKPTGSALASEGVGDSSIPSGSGSSGLTVTFSSPASLSSGTTYALVIRFPDASGSARYNLNVFSATEGNIYTDGREWKSTDGGSTWGDGTYGADSDVGLVTYMFEPTTTTQTINSAALIKATTSQTIDSDTVIKTTSEQTINADTKVILIFSRTLPSTATILATITQAISSAARIRVAGQEIIESDAVILKTSEQTIASNALIKATASQLLSSDAHIEAEMSQALSSLAQIQVTQTQTINGMAVIQGTISQQINCASCVSIPVTKTIDCAAVIIVTEPILKLYIVV